MTDSQFNISIFTFLTNQRSHVNTVIGIAAVSHLAFKFFKIGRNDVFLFM